MEDEENEETFTICGKQFTSEELADMFDDSFQIERILGRKNTESTDIPRSPRTCREIDVGCRGDGRVRYKRGH